MTLAIHEIITKKGCVYYCENNEEESFFMNEIINETVVNAVKLLKSTKRRLEKYTVHYILQQIFPLGYQLNYHENGKPFLGDSKYHISISHSKSFIAVFISNSTTLGVDVEYVSAKIKKVTAKFINIKEEALITKELDYTLIWSAKEAVYKSFNTVGIDYKNNINCLCIDEDKKELNIELHYHDLNTFCKLHYQIINGFTLVYHE